MPRHNDPCRQLLRPLTRASILADYQLRFAPKLAAELSGFAAASIGQIAEAKLAGRLMDHQHRLRKEVYRSAARKLRRYEAALKGCLTFDELHAMVDRLFKPVPGAGPVFTYDTALRIGVSIKPPLRPDRVYLHAGSLGGARKLNVRGRTVPVTAFPDFASLSAHEIENLLCLYESCLQ